MGIMLKNHLPCNTCSGSDCVTEYDTNWYCWSCHTYTRKVKSTLVKQVPQGQKPKHFQVPICQFDHAPTLEWLAKAYISPDVAQLAKIGFSIQQKRIILPVFNQATIIGYQARRPINGQGPKYLTYKKNNIPIWYEIITKKDEVVVVVEDILSAIRISPFCNVIALLGTTYEGAVLHRLSQFQTVVIWLDSDQPGQTAAQSLSQRLSLVTQLRHIVTTVDPKYLTDKEIHRILYDYRRSFTQL